MTIGGRERAERRQAEATPGELPGERYSAGVRRPHQRILVTAVRSAYIRGYPRTGQDSPLARGSAVGRRPERRT